MTGWDPRASELHNTPNGNDGLAMVLPGSLSRVRQSKGH